MKSPANPIELETSHFRPELIVFHQRGFVVARGVDKKSGNITMACRWHNDGTGYPSSRGYPQWMFLPDGTDWSKLEAPLSPNGISLMLRGETVLPREGDWILDDCGAYHLVTYCYGDNTILACIGQGKADSYPITTNCVRKVIRKYRSLLSKWHGDDLCIWMDSSGAFHATWPSYHSESGHDTLGNVYSKMSFVYGAPDHALFIPPSDGEVSNYVVSRHMAHVGYTYQLDSMYLLYKGDFEGNPVKFVQEKLDELRTQGAMLNPVERNFFKEVEAEAERDRVEEEVRAAKNCEELLEEHEQTKTYHGDIDTVFEDVTYQDCTACFS